MEPVTITNTTTTSPTIPRRAGFFANYRMPIILVVVVLLLGGIIYVGYNYWKESQVVIVENAVTNLTNGTATISWRSDVPTKSMVFYGTDNTFSPLFPALLKNVEYDDRDVEVVELNAEESVKSTGLKERYTHHVTIEGLNADTTYYYRIASGFMKPIETDANGGQYVSFKTGPVMDELVTPQPLYGKIVTEDGSTMSDPEDVVIKLTLLRADGKFSSPVSAVSNFQGGFSLDVANIRYILSDDLTGDDTTDVFDQTDVAAGDFEVLSGYSKDIQGFTRVLNKDIPIDDLVLNK